MKLYELLKPELVKLNTNTSDTESLLLEILKDIKLKTPIPNDKIILKKLLDREKMGTTAIGNYTAVPHAKLKDITSPIVYITIAKKGIYYQGNNEEPVHIIILILSPSDSPILHLQILAAAASFAKKLKKKIKSLFKSNTPEELINTIKEIEENEL